MFSNGKKYTYPVSFRTKLINIFRYLFTHPRLEQFLVAKISGSRSGLWRKLIPPLYLYSDKSFRTVARDRIHYRLDISKYLDHAAYYFKYPEDTATGNLFNVLKKEFHVVDIGAN